MKVYITSKNSGPSWSDERKFMTYIGTSLEAARDAVDEKFRRHEKTPADFPKRMPFLFSIIPERTPNKMVAYYEADGWWFSIVRLDFEEDE